jgi:hypothetical protein
VTGAIQNIRKANDPTTATYDQTIQTQGMIPSIARMSMRA